MTNVQRASRWKGRQEGRALSGLGTGDTTVTRREEYRSSTSTKLSIRGAQITIQTIEQGALDESTKYSLGHRARDGVLVLTVAGGENLWWGSLTE